MSEVVVVCKSTRYGAGCGHPVGDHNGAGDCCCCSGRHNDPSHVAECIDCSVTHGEAHCGDPFLVGSDTEHRPHDWYGLYDRYRCPGGLGLTDRQVVESPKGESKETT